MQLSCLDFVFTAQVWDRDASNTRMVPVKDGPVEAEEVEAEETTA